MDNSSAAGKTFISPGVLITVAKLAALGVPGVARMSPVPGGVNQLFRRGTADGVRLETNDETVSADLYLVVEQDYNVREVARQVQHEVARAIRDLIGLEVGRLDIHLEDIDLAPAGPPAAEG
jgi:uncharacterized alkaline shock family protein YloU